MCRFYKSVLFVVFDRCFLLHKVYMKSNPTKTPTRVDSHETQIRYYINQSDIILCRFDKICVFVGIDKCKVYIK